MTQLQFVFLAVQQPRLHPEKVHCDQNLNLILEFQPVHHHVCHLHPFHVKEISPFSSALASLESFPPLLRLVDWLSTILSQSSLEPKWHQNCCFITFARHGCSAQNVNCRFSSRNVRKYQYHTLDPCLCPGKFLRMMKGELLRYTWMGSVGGTCKGRPWCQGPQARACSGHCYPVLLLVVGGAAKEVGSKSELLSQEGQCRLSLHCSIFSGHQTVSPHPSFTGLAFTHI